MAASLLAADVAVISLDMYNDASRLIDSNFDGEYLQISDNLDMHAFPVQQQATSVWTYF